MLVLGVNKILKWCQITTDGRRYTCPVKEINGVLCFAFKNAWHPVAEFISDHAEDQFKKVEEFSQDRLQNDSSKRRG